MKYVVMIGDGMADRPRPELAGKTPLEAAFTPNMDKLAREGMVGMAHTLPDGLPTGSDVANLSILGYDPHKYYTGRAPFEAASMGLRLRPGDVAFRCNLVTLRFNEDKSRAWMEDHGAGQISSEEGRELIEDLNRDLKMDGISFHPGVSYRNIMLWPNGRADCDCTPPHDILGREITDFLPQGAGGEFLRALMHGSVDVLERHPINKKRMAEGKRPANSIWLWGQGMKPELPPFEKLYGLRGGMISAVDLTKGIAVSAGLSVINVPGATGYLDTNYAGKAESALRALEELDLVYIHVEAPDEASHEGNLREKIEAIERFDNLVVGTVLRGIRELGDFRLLVMPDHATPLEVRTHTQEPVPFAVYDGTERDFSRASGYSEAIASVKNKIEIKDASKLMGQFIKGEF